MIGVLKYTGTITNFSVWDHIINTYVKKFHEQYNVYPNIFIACELTHRKIDFRALTHHPERLTDDDGENLKTSSMPYLGIRNFEANNYTLRFCIDNKLPDDMFMLVFDAAPEFDGEPIPEEVEETQYYYKKCA